MKKVCFIVPYFGELPNYFQLFLESCSINENYEWLIITDDQYQYNYPKNVRRIVMSFEELRTMVSSKFDFKISLDTPRKLCDYKPAYGFIFEKYLDGYEYWGHCDIDTIMGNLDNFLPPLLEKKYDKIFTLGHFILYKNSKENNRRFMKSFKGCYLYKQSFQTDDITTFDETYGNDNNVNSVFIENGAKVYEKDLSFNVNLYISRFTRIVYSNKQYITLKYPLKILFIWSKNGLRYFYVENNKLKSKKVMYIHLQQRKMKINRNLRYNDSPFAIIPNEFYSLNGKIPVSVDDFYKLKRNAFSFQREKMFFKWKWFGLKKKIKALFK